MIGAAARAAEPVPASRPGRRLVALDRLRGVVMLLMVVDHASEELNGGRLFTDSALLYAAGTPLPPAQFLTRWMTHLCAPTFVFLAGAALALSVERRSAAGEPARALDRFIATRGLLIAALDPLWMSWVLAPGHVLLQVLWAIGGSLVAMVPLRRLSTRALVGVALVLIVGGEALVGVALAASGGTPSLPVALFLTGGRFGSLIVGYPLLPWLAIMLLGWALGRRLARGDVAGVRRLLVPAGIVALALFAVVRGVNGYGNMRLLRDDGSLVQWLHVSKYPPSLSYATLELGIMALALAAFFAVAPTTVPAGFDPLLVFGQTALVFYLLHVHVLAAGARATGLQHHAGLAATYLGAAATSLALYPVCRRYRAYKQRHPDGWARYF